MFGTTDGIKPPAEDRYFKLKEVALAVPNVTATQVWRGDGVESAVQSEGPKTGLGSICISQGEKVRGLRNVSSTKVTLCPHTFSHLLALL